MILEVKNGSFSYGSREVLKDVSFHLEEQENHDDPGAKWGGKDDAFKVHYGFSPMEQRRNHDFRKEFDGVF